MAMEGLIVDKGLKEQVQELESELIRSALRITDGAS